MTPLSCLLSRHLPPRTAQLVLALIYAGIIVALILAVGGSPDLDPNPYIDLHRGK